MYYNVQEKEKSLSYVPFFAIPWTVACPVPLSLGFSRQEYWSELPFPLGGILKEGAGNSAYS